MTPHATQGEGAALMIPPSLVGVWKARAVEDAGTLFFVAQYFQLVRGLSPLGAGLWMVPMALGVVAGAITTGTVIKKVRPPVIMRSGLLVSCGVFALLSQMSVDSPIALFVGGVFCVYFGVSPVMILGLELAVGSAPPERAGAASSAAETIQWFALGLGVAVIGSIGTAVHRSELKGELPADVPADAARAAEDTLGGAVHSAADLADGTGDTLLSLARSAFTEGLQAAATLCAVWVVLGSLVAFTVLRGMGGPGGHQDQDGAEKAEAAP
ncbi:MFS transporter [Streptomyces globisporus]